MSYNALQLIGSFHQGGSERQAVQLTRLLLESGRCNVFVATLEREGVLLDEINRLGFKDVPEFRLNSFYDLHAVRQVRRFAQFLKKARDRRGPCARLLHERLRHGRRSARACAGPYRLATRIRGAARETEICRTLLVSNGPRRGGKL